MKHAETNNQRRSLKGSLKLASRSTVYTLFLLILMILPGCDNSNSVSKTVPDVITGVSLEGGEACITVSWNASSFNNPAPDYYTVYWGTESGVFTSSHDITFGTNQYTITSLENGTEYFITITASNTEGESDLSDEESATPEIPMTVPDVVSGLMVDANDSQITVSWTGSVFNNPVPDNYIVYWGTESGDYTSSHSVSFGTNEYTVTGLENGTEYFVVVTATNSIGESDLSSEETAVPFIEPSEPPAVTGVVLVSGIEQVTVQWAHSTFANPAPSKYTVYWGTSSGSYSDSADVDISKNMFTIEDLNGGSDYFVAVTATNSIGESSLSVEKSVTAFSPFTSCSQWLSEGGVNNSFGFADGEGTEASPFVVCTPEHLEQVNENMDKQIIIRNNIDLSSNENWISLGKKGYTTMVEFTGSITTETEEVEGELVAKYSVSGMKSSGLYGFSYAGLFAKIGAGGSVSYLKIEDMILTYEDALHSQPSGGIAVTNEGSIRNCSVTGTIGFDEYGFTSGGICSENKGIIENCSFSGTINSEYKSGGISGKNMGGTILNCTVSVVIPGNQDIGGITGYDENGTITGCSASGTITGSYKIGGLLGYGENTRITSSSSSASVEASWNVGGLIGEGNNVEVQNSFTTGTVTDISEGTYNNIGGLIGIMNGGTVTECYSTSTVTGFFDVGGLVGQQNGGIITLSYHQTGTVSANYNVGGLVGYSHDGTVSYSFTISNVETQTGATDYQYCGGLIGLNTSSVINCSASGNTSGWLYTGGLIGKNDGGSVSGSWFETGTVTGYQNIGGIIGFNKEGTVDNCYSTGAVAGTDTANFNYAGGLIGLNTGTVTSSWSSVTLTGNEEIGGLIGRNEKAAISNCHTKDVVITGVSRTGGLIGINSGGAISSCYSTCAVNGEGVLGGLIGRNEEFSSESEYSGSVTECHAIGNVTGTKNENGGLIGTCQDGVVSFCYATGAVEGRRNIGGLIGHTFDEVNNSYATGSVTGTDYYIGGLFGTSEANITNCYATGTVTTPGDFVGGLVGQQGSGSRLSTVSKCYATGNVNGDLYVGGLIGKTYAAQITIEYCFAEGNAAGTDCVGGLIGDQSGVVTSCYATGSATGDQKTGGLIGDLNLGAELHSSYSTGTVNCTHFWSGGLIGNVSTTPTVTSSYWNIDLSGKTTSKAGTGLTDTQMKNSSNFIGFDFTTVWAIDTTVNNGYPYLQDNVLE